MKSKATLGDLVGAWKAERENLVERFRPLYAAEIERLAEELRPRFESGELRAFADGDEDELEAGTDAGTSPHWKVERACAKRLGLVVDDTGQGDGIAAEFVLSASPNAEKTDSNWSHPCFWAQAAAAWDVIQLARRRCWYIPAPDEQLAPGLEDELAKTPSAAV